MNFGQRYWENSADFSNNIVLWDKSLKSNETPNKGSIPTKVKIVQIGIQTQPGVVFRINDNGNIIVGKTGIYEIDISDTNAEISKIEYIANYDEVPVKYIILDAVYKGGTE